MYASYPALYASLNAAAAQRWVIRFRLSDRPFDPAVTACAAWIPAAAGLVPTGARASRVHTGGNVFANAEVTARGVA